MGGVSAAAVIIPAVAGLVGLGIAKKALPSIPTPTLPPVADLPPPVEEKDIETGAQELAKRRRGAIGVQQRRSARPASLLSDDLSNTLLGG